MPATELVAQLRVELRHLRARAKTDELTSLLLRAGELECALLDAQPHVNPTQPEERGPLSPEIADGSGSRKVDDASSAAKLTDLIADALVVCDATQRSCHGHLLSSEALRILDGIHPSGSLSVTTPEGFTYYALHPLDFADLVMRMSLRAREAVVVGIRSIGTTLSAVVAATLRRRDITAQRTTARPSGHPYERYCQLGSGQKEQLAGALAANALFLICDEGPGRSGSSLLSVAEALEREGVSHDRIVILSSHEAKVGQLCSPDAGRRWRRYPSAATGTTRRLPRIAGEFIGGGQWRKGFVPDGDRWPAAWPQMEPLKFISVDEQAILKFEGYGHYGALIRDRHEALADAGFGSPYLGHDLGFGQHQRQVGRMGRGSDLTPELLEHMANYCAWRGHEFGVTDADAGNLETMTRVNFKHEFDRALGGVTLPLVRPTICDARMQPHEWLYTSEGRWFKLDAATHGNDHFFPGPCDIAWDLAGVIVEWELDSSARDFLLRTYRQASGDNAARRIAAYEVAYATLRFAWSRMAAASVGDLAEEERLLRDYIRYRQTAEKLAQGWPSGKRHRLKQHGDYLPEHEKAS